MSETSLKSQSQRKNKPKEKREEKIVELIGAIGQAMTNTNLYGTEHDVAADTIRAAHAQLQAHLKAHRTIVFGLNESQLLVDGYSVPCQNPLVRTFRDSLNRLKISNFSLKPGITIEELKKLLVLFLADEDDGDSGDHTDHFREKLARNGFRYVAAKKVTIREIGDNEMIVSKDSFAGLEDLPGVAANSDHDITDKDVADADKHGMQEPDETEEQQQRELRMQYVRALRQQMQQGKRGKAPKSKTGKIPAPKGVMPPGSEARKKWEEEWKRECGDSWNIDAAMAADIETKRAAKPARVKTKTDAAEPAAGQSPASAEPAAEAPAPGGEAPTPTLSLILAFLRADSKNDHENAIRELWKIRDNANRLTQLIVKATMMQCTAESASEPTAIHEALLACLKRAAFGLERDPKAQTTDGLAMLADGLTAIQTNLHARLEQLYPDEFPEIAPMLEDFFRKQRQKITFRAVSADYATRHKALAESEDKIRRLIKSAGVEAARDGGLEKMLHDAGMPKAAWKRLIPKK